jgi:hypothetical protein
MQTNIHEEEEEEELIDRIIVFDRDKNKDMSVNKQQSSLSSF